MIIDNAAAVQSMVLLRRITNKIIGTIHAHTKDRTGLMQEQTFTKTLHFLQARRETTVSSDAEVHTASAEHQHQLSVIPLTQCEKLTLTL